MSELLKSSTAIPAVLLDQMAADGPKGVSLHPADLDSTTGCSPIGSVGKSPRFVPIPHGNKGLRNRRMPRTQVSRLTEQAQLLAMRDRAQSFYLHGLFREA